MGPKLIDESLLVDRCLGTNLTQFHHFRHLFLRQTGFFGQQGVPQTTFVFIEDVGFGKNPLKKPHRKRWRNAGCERFQVFLGIRLCTLERSEHVGHLGSNSGFFATSHSLLKLFEHLIVIRGGSGGFEERVVRSGHRRHLVLLCGERGLKAFYFLTEEVGFLLKLLHPHLLAFAAEARLLSLTEKPLLLDGLFFDELHHFLFIHGNRRPICPGRRRI
mmetsp:Transcript_7752/g.14424  ORF Transcript_7752/g.14424 Transcript_7752/m.14424 type:complete len:217 (-) Transcript_7752:818-1468(-)